MNEEPIILQFQEVVPDADYALEERDGTKVVTRLGLEGVRFPEMPAVQHFALLSELRHLKDLDLERCLLSNDGFRHFAGCKTVEKLNLNECRKLTDEALKTAASFTQLTALYASDTEFSGAGLKYIAGCHSLRTLYLANCSTIDNNALAVLPHFTGLVHLDVSMTAVSAVGMVHLAQLPKLRKLDLFQCDVDDSAIPSIATLQTLEVLDLKDTLISRRGFNQLKKALPDCSIKFSQRSL